MSNALPLVLIALLAIGLVIWTFTTQRRRRQAQQRALEQLGLSPCPDRTQWLEEAVAHIESNSGYRYEVHDPMVLDGESPVYYYVKSRHSDAHEESVTEEEMLFAVQRPSSGGVVLTVKPSSLASGLATRLLGSVATGSWDAQPDDLHGLDLPRDLAGTNLLGALGPPGANLHDLVDPKVVDIVQRLGDAGGVFVRFRDGWCTVAGPGGQIPFRVAELVARIRPLL